MAIYSMTGFARAQIRVHDQLSYTLSVKSVNHRFLDVQLRLPSGLDALEMELRKALKDNLVRGHVELTLSVDRSSLQTTGYNRELVAGYLSAFAAASQEHGLVKATTAPAATKTLMLCPPAWRRRSRPCSSN
jgi:uncharacterized protein (TIGR00255 family)